MTARSRALLAVFAALAFVAVACTGSDDPTADPADSADTAPAPQPEPDLVADCLAGDMVACDHADRDASAGDWPDEVSDTCGYRIPLDPTASCVTHVADITIVGTAPALDLPDAPWNPDLPPADPDVADDVDDRCLTGHWEDCDRLVDTTARGSDLFTLGASCGYLLPRPVPFGSCEHLADLLDPADLSPGADPADIATERFDTWVDATVALPTPEPTPDPAPMVEPEGDLSHMPPHWDMPIPPNRYINREMKPTEVWRGGDTRVGSLDWYAEGCLYRAQYCANLFWDGHPPRGSWYRYVANTCGFRAPRPTFYVWNDDGEMDRCEDVMPRPTHTPSHPLLRERR